MRGIQRVEQTLAAILAATLLLLPIERGFAGNSIILMGLSRAPKNHNHYNLVAMSQKHHVSSTLVDHNLRREKIYNACEKSSSALISRAPSVLQRSLCNRLPIDSLIQMFLTRERFASCSRKALFESMWMGKMHCAEEPWTVIARQQLIQQFWLDQVRNGMQHWQQSIQVPTQIRCREHKGNSGHRPEIRRGR